ncbi:uncharacterized protein [Drosophila takahashii]|uniref:uncharacterized protein n=1 Tax=Drosophila takahashii TaxID=29030 RepID=UPI0007E69CCA|nr:uncharacterized protein LOC108063438 [Drosophila takahashii]
MGNIAVVILLLSFLAIVQPLIKRPGVNYCTLGVVVIRRRVMCEPLRSLWVLRDGKCKEALHCMDGYSRKECQENCLKQFTTKAKPKPMPQPKPKPLTTCGTTEAEIKTTTVQYETTARGDLPSTRETRRPKRTRRTRRFTVKELC